MKSRLVKHSRVETYGFLTDMQKDHERQRRAGEGSTEYQLAFNSTLHGRDAFMKNKQNNKQLAQRICTHDLGNNIKRVSRAGSIVKHDEADISLIRYMLYAVSRGAKTVRILSYDTYDELFF